MKRRILLLVCLSACASICVAAVSTPLKTDLSSGSAAVMRERLGFNNATSNGIAKAASIYFAPENSFLFRMRNPDGSYREFQRNLDLNDSSLLSVRGWHGEIHGDQVVIESGKYVKGGRARYVFDRGRLVTFTQHGVSHDFPYAAERPATDGGPPFAFAFDDPDGVSRHSAQEDNTRKKEMVRELQSELKEKWAKSGRLQWPFSNPNDNGFLYLAIAIFSTGLLFIKSKTAKIVGGIAFAAATMVLVATASRGAFLAFAVGLVPLCVLNFKALVRSKAVWTLSGVFILVVTIWLSTYGSQLLTRGFTKSTRWSNDIRLEMWKAAPSMIAEAPNGWGEMHVGRAYMDWYEDLEGISLSASLVNDHLTKLVGLSRYGRFGYIFIWVFSLALMSFTALRSRRAVALGIALGLLVCGWFNAVMMNSIIRFTPWFILIGFLAGRPWRQWRFKTVSLILVFSALISVITLFAIYNVGGGRAKRGYPILVENGQVRVKAKNPDIWIVDDGIVLGGVFSCRDIRSHYLFDRTAPAVGYVRSIADLPKKGVRRLVLAGNAGDEWLRFVSEGGEKARENLPAEVMFISPPFPPSALPGGLFTSCKVLVLVGEFAARYDPEYRKPPAWVTVIPAMELYISGWMRYAVGK